MPHEERNQRVRFDNGAFTSPWGGREGIVARGREWLGLKELSYYADISERTLRSWIHAPLDPLPAAKVRGKVLVRRSDFDSYLQQHQIKRVHEINLEAVMDDVLKGVRHGR